MAAPVQNNFFQTHDALMNAAYHMKTYGEAMDITDNATDNDSDSSGWTSSGDESSGDEMSEDYSDDSSYDSDLSEEMESFRAPITIKKGSSPAPVALDIPPHKPLVTNETLRKQNLIGVDSSPAFQSIPGMPASLMQRMMKAEVFIGDSPSNSRLPAAHAAPAPTIATPKFPVKDPNEMFAKILESRGMKAKSISAMELNGFFLQMKEENVSGYTMQKAAAVRTEDIGSLRAMLQCGQTLQVCNQFGESVVHSACRRGSTRVLEFLVQEAQVSVRVVDDYGRTPMHDACWTARANLEIVKIILCACPDLLLIADTRGFTPLQYIRKDLWNEWCQFIESNEDLLVPRDLVQLLR
jgi:hypothetical protein